MKLASHFSWQNKQWWFGTYAAIAIFSLGTAQAAPLEWLLMQPFLLAGAFFLAPQFRRTVRVNRGEEELGPHPWRQVVWPLLFVAAVFAIGFIFHLSGSG